MKNFTLTALLISIISLCTFGQCNFDYTYSIDTLNNLITFNNTSVTSEFGHLYMYPDAVNGNPSSYVIDNNFITNSSTTVAYSDGDTYVDVCLYTENLTNGCLDTICKTIYLPNPCGFTLNLNVVNNMDGSVTYTNTNNNDILFETGVNNYFENSYFLTSGQSITHDYNSNGTFPYLVTVDDSSTLNCYDTNYREVTVADTNSTNCTADASFNADSFNNDLNYNFYAIDSTNNCLYFWDFGDGTTGTNWSENHTYSAAGTYTVCLTVTTCDSFYCADTICQTITVVDSSSTACNITANYNWYQAYDSLNSSWLNSVYIVDYSSGSNLSYEWSFGDGTTSNQQYPTHNYNAIGDYLVCLTVTDLDSCISTFCDTILVQTKASGFTLQVISQSAVGIKENNQFEVGNVYPNPASENSFISISTNEYSDITITILDLTGKIVTQEVNSIDVGQHLIDLNTNNLTAGMYLVSVSNADRILTNQRLVKK